MPSASGFTKGLGYEISDAAQQDLLGFTGQVRDQLYPELTSYRDWIDKLTSTDPTQRMAAAGPAVADITKQTEGVKKGLENLPRGGERNELMAEADISKGAQIGDYLNKVYTEAQQAKGKLGEFGLVSFNQMLQEFANMESQAAQISLGQQGVGNQSQSNMAANLGQLAMMFASM
jgi:hypothetical protein